MKVKKMSTQLGWTAFMAMAATLSMPAAHAGFGLPDIPIPGA